MRNFFKGISFSQIMAGALAAVTSFLLSAKIGIAGSLIGVAVGSIVSAVASQIYQNVLHESGKKLQEAAPFVSDDYDSQSADDGQEGAKKGFRTKQASSLVASQSLGDAVEGTASLAQLARTGASGPRAATAVHAADEKGKNGERGSATASMPAIGDKTTVIGLDSGGRTVQGKQGSRVVDGLASNKKFGLGDQKRNKRTMVIISIVSALVAVAITAGIITFVTHGNGTDDVVRNVVNNSQLSGNRKTKPNQGTTDQQSGTPNTHDGNDGTGNNTNGNNSRDSGKGSAGNPNDPGSGSTGSGSSGSGSGSGPTSNNGSGSNGNKENGGTGTGGSGTGNGTGGAGGTGTGESSGTDSGSTGSDGASNGSGQTAPSKTGNSSAKIN